jgi:hypothetical protein
VDTVVLGRFSASTSVSPARFRSSRMLHTVTVGSLVPGVPSGLSLHTPAKLNTHTKKKEQTREMGWGEGVD